MVFTAFPDQIQSADGFGPPALGGIRNTLFAAFAYNSTGIATGFAQFTIPYNAEIVGWLVNITTAFNGTGTNTLDVGISGALTTYAAALNPGATGQITAGYVAAAMFTKLTADAAILVRYNGTSPSTGAGFLCVDYITRGTP